MASFRKIKQRYRYSVILLRELVRTDFKLRYQGSVLGYLWSLLRPLFLFVIMYLVFVYFLRIGRGVPHWPVALLLGIVMWSFFTEITNQGLKAIVSKSSLIRQLNFPKYVILLAVSFSALINLCINLVVVAVFMYFNQVPLSWTILLTPVFILELYLVALGVAFILSTWYVKFRDINFVWEIVVQAMFYGSAIMFPVSKVLELQHGETLSKIMLMNPVAQSIQDARYMAVSHDLPTLYSISGSLRLALVPVLLAFIILGIGAYVFRKNSPYFAENV
ncbi:ABC transporter permease [Candidatus Saccharibacteria bacterium]|nr:ABC transporter permease [Candidatus Saccharibacteria bacterium]